MLRQTKLRTYFMIAIGGVVVTLAIKLSMSEQRIFRSGAPEEYTPMNAAVAQSGVAPYDVGWQVYRDEDYGFSIRYPRDHKIVFFNEGVGRMTLIRNSTLTSEVQIFLTRSDEGEINPERLLGELSESDIGKMREVEVAGVKGVSFVSDGGEMRQVWFTHGGFLYQLTAEHSSAGLFEQLLSQWEF